MPITNTKANKTDAGNGSYGICRVIEGCQRPPALPFGLPLASDVAPLHSRSPSPDPKRKAAEHAMSKDEMHTILSEHLAKFRTWSYAQLAERVERDRQTHDCLEHVEGTTADGTKYQMEFQALWNDQPHGEVIVFGDLSADPQRPLWGFIPIYTPDVTDSFIMSPDGHIVA